MVWNVTWIGGAARVEADSQAEALQIVKDKICEIELTGLIVEPVPGE